MSRRVDATAQRISPRISPRIATYCVALTVTTLLIVCTRLGADEVSYNREIQPLLSKHCYTCHGPDENRSADVRLDVPDHVDLDAVVERINSTDPYTVMPPPETNKPLSKEDIARIEDWIDQGAPYEKHWAFVPPTRPKIPRASEGQSLHPIDRFIDRKLSAKGWSRSPQADPHVLVRRVYLDLIGLPPPIEVADRFAADPTPQSFEAIVDDLLSSPRYGERWARRWLDLARYADTNGYEKDRDRSIWPYRDWVIKAINQDMPFDQFTVEQLAGDMLTGDGENGPTTDQLIATGFHRNTMLNEEGGIDPLEFRFHAMTDRVATTGTTWLGLTTGCAQCHTHKYDPITHHDYFGMMAYLNNADEPKLYLPIENAEALRGRDLAKADELAAELESHWPQRIESRKASKAGKVNSKNPRELEQALRDWIESEKANQTDWQVLVPAEMQTNLPRLTLEDKGVIFADGDTSKHDTYDLDFAAHAKTIHSIQLEVLPDDRLPARGPGMTDYEGPEGDFFLSEFQIESFGEQRHDVIEATETDANNGFGNNPATAEEAVDGDIQTGWAIARRGAGRRNVAVFRLEQPIAAGTEFRIRMHFGRHYASSLGKFRIHVTSDPDPVKATLLGPEWATRLAAPNAKHDPVVREAFLMQAPELQKHAEQIRKLRTPRRGTSTLVMQERPADHPRPTYLHHRGEFLQPTERVEPRLPDALLSSDVDVPANRLEFARWLVAPENPLTARVVVNRHWAALFGTGLVSTVDDFGTMGTLPTHPELLDYLAVELMNNRWSIKRLHRLIVTSETYQQSSAVSSDATVVGIDRLLGRFPRHRLEAEIIRDTSLAAAGLLSERMYGPPVRPPQPASARAANYSRSTWQASQGEDRYRRSIYTYQKRTAPFAMFTTFDAGSGEACIARRDVSNTPLQALTLMNDPMFVEIAEAYGKAMRETEGDVKSKIENGFRRLMTRSPRPTELEMMLAFYRKHQDFTALARVMLCVDEAITKN